jgi:hypothetical protein
LAAPVRSSATSRPRKTPRRSVWHGLRDRGGQPDSARGMYGPREMLSRVRCDRGGGHRKVLHQGPRRSWLADARMSSSG